MEEYVSCFPTHLPRCEIDMNRDLEITVAEEVRKFPALYDKQCKEYHRKDVQRNCWEKVASEVELESGKNTYLHVVFL